MAAPFKSVQIREKGNILYNVTKQQLGNHPAFSYRREGLYGYHYEPFYLLPAYGLKREYRYPPLPPYGQPHMLHFEEENTRVSMVSGNGNTSWSASVASGGDRHAADSNTDSGLRSLYDTDWLGLGTRGMGRCFTLVLFNDRVKLAAFGIFDQYQPGLLLKGSNNLQRPSLGSA